MFGCHCGPCPGDIHNRFGVGSTGAVIFYLGWMLKGWKPLIHLAFLENPSTFKMVHIFNSNKKKKYIVRKKLYSEECAFNLEC